MAETFGNLNKEPSDMSFSSGYISGCKFPSGSEGVLASITVYNKTTTGSGNMKCALYDASLNFVANGGTEEKAVGTSHDDWITFNFPTPPSVSAATVYYLCEWGNFYRWIYYGSGGSNQLFYKVVAYNGWPASITSPELRDRTMSIYATYEEAPPPAGKTLVQAALISIPPLIVIPTLSQILKVTGG